MRHFRSFLVKFKGSNIYITIKIFYCCLSVHTIDTQLLASAIRLWPRRFRLEKCFRPKPPQTRTMFRGAFGVVGERRGTDGLAMLSRVVYFSRQTTKLVIYGKYETSKHCACADLALMARASCPPPRDDGLDQFCGTWRRNRHLAS